MRHNQARYQTPKTITVHMKSGSKSLQENKFRLKRPVSKGNEYDNPESKRLTGPCLIVRRQEMAAFFKIFDDDLIQDFLWMDSCYKIADKYLLAMTFVYFKRVGFSVDEYTRNNFFAALYLANTMEEDYEEAKYEIFPWVLGKNWRKFFRGFLTLKDNLWSMLNYRAAVSKRCCDEVMAIAPTHYIWQRERTESHSGALRTYSNGEFCVPRGPCATPQDCSLCGKKGQHVGVGLSDSSSSSSSSSDTTMSEHVAPHNIPDSPGDKMLIDPPQCYHYHQDNQANGKTRRSLRKQDKSMDWFPSNEED
ncbi:speedy protein A [Anomaloglossus baeobatrachus]|uniref:speedy protein A n=1 Tax=Anomaloglossus baeobatrachus TaxID=238106 RepID=UPI003F4F877F